MAFKGLSIGFDRYASAEINWLSCANRDATALRALFTDTLGGETVLLTDEEATVAAIGRTVWATRSLHDDVVVMVFSVMGPRRMNSSDLTPIRVTSQERRFR